MCIHRAYTTNTNVSRASQNLCLTISSDASTRHSDVCVILCWIFPFNLHFSCRIPQPHPNMAKLVTNSPAQMLNGELYYYNSHGKLDVLHAQFCTHLAHECIDLVHVCARPVGVCFDVTYGTVFFFPFSVVFPIWEIFLLRLWLRYSTS